MRYESIDPTSGVGLESFKTATDPEIEIALELASSAARDWRDTRPSIRAEPLSRMAEFLEARAPVLATLMATEMGKPVAQGESEIRKCAWGCRHFAERAGLLLEPRAEESDGSRAFVRYDPLGPLLAIMPWNFPFWQLYRFAAPAVMAGNVVLLKHAPNTPRCAREIERLFCEAGFPAGVLQNLYLSNEQAARVIGDRRVRGVTLTGSTRAGREVAEIAGRHLKPIVLELGGSDPFIVFEDADLDRAVATGVSARCLNNGQSCIAAKRFLVERSVFDRFRDPFVEAMRRQRVGDPRDRATDVGPLARRDLRDRLASQVASSVAFGARVLCGGGVPDRAGWFYTPAVLTDVPAESPAAREELFGPVAVLQAFDTEEDAVHLANATDFGLGASLWTGDAVRAARLVPHIEAGSVFVNGQVKSDPRLPFGGIKDSGFGRELGREGLLEFVNLKTVWFA